MLVVGVAIGVIGYGCSLLPPIYMESSYWTSSPTFFLVRLGIIIALVPAAFAWSALTFRTGGAAPIREMGVASLFVYWIHVEMVYGIVSTPLHRALSLPQVLAAMTVLAAFLYGLVRLKHWAVKGRTIGEIQTFFARSRARLAPQPPQSR